MINRPQLDNLALYLDSLNRLELIRQDLNNSDLNFCKISIERAEGAISDAHSKLQVAFKNWLVEIQSPKYEGLNNETATATTTKNETKNETVIFCLKTIVDFSSNSNSSVNNFSSLLNDWVEIRSDYLAASCEPLFNQSQIFEKDPNTYKLNSHPLPAAFKLARRLLLAEEQFISKVWPSTVAGPTFLRSAQIVRDLAVSTVESITGKMKKALAKREYSDQVYLFPLIGQSYLSVFNNENNNPEIEYNSNNNSPPSFAIQVLLPSLKYFIVTTATLLTDLIGEIRGTIPRALERPFPVPQNATVYELTSVSVNVLKRLEGNGPILEAVLKGQASDNWDGSLEYCNENFNEYTDPTDSDPENPTNSIDSTDINPLQLPNTKKFFLDTLSSLETSIDAKSKTFRRPMQTLLFQLNNYNYLVKGIGGFRSGLVDGGVIKRYEQIVDALLRSFFNRYYRS